ncbi:MAG: LytTR family DNA-binding domain-containing protein [Bacteroidia bacterium]|nr:LytTR family DNA-binding domain-containing protein [Bacteroidia bacterium]
MLKAIAIDDEPEALEVIRLLAQKIPYLKLQTSFTDALAAMDFLQKNEVDLVFLDIKMPDISGTELAKALVNPPMIIFTTAFSEYAAESYELEALDYLVKPIAFNRFLKAVNKAAQLQKEEQQNFTFVKSGHLYERIDFDTLLFLKGAANYVDFVSQEKKVVVRMKLGEAKELLPENFVQVHRSYLVNIRHIQKVEHNHIYMGEEKISIGQAYKDNFWESLGDWGS